jgi:hypothetical protein
MGRELNHGTFHHLTNQLLISRLNLRVLRAMFPSADLSDSRIWPAVHR